MQKVSSICNRGPARERELEREECTKYCFLLVIQCRSLKARAGAGGAAERDAQTVPGGGPGQAAINRTRARIPIAIL